MTNIDTERQAFDSWWLASKYRQVIYANDSMRQIALDGWLARAKAGGGVDGWKLVPIEPMKEQLKAATTMDTTPRDAKTDDWNRITYMLMVESAPSPPKEDGE